MLWKSCLEFWTQEDHHRTGQKATILVNSSVKGTNFDINNLENKGVSYTKFMFKRCCLLKLTILINFDRATTQV